MFVIAAFGGCFLEFIVDYFVYSFGCRSLHLLGICCFQLITTFLDLL